MDTLQLKLAAARMSRDRWIALRKDRIARRQNNDYTNERVRFWIRRVWELEDLAEAIQVGDCM
jgi:hypothetical protein